MTPWFLIFWMAAALCPSRDTMYAIAASQLGEQVLHTQVSSKAEQALETWLDAQIRKNQTSSNKENDQ